MLVAFIHIPVSDRVRSEHSRSNSRCVKSNAGAIKPCVVNSDFVVTNADGVIVVIQAKTFWNSNMHTSCLILLLLCAMYGAKSETSAERLWQRNLSQIYGYIMDQHYRYGVLTNYNTTWF